MSDVVVVLEPVDAAGLDLLSDGGMEVVDATGLAGEERDRRLATASAIVVRSGTAVDAGLMDKAPRLKAIARAGVGLDNVDVDEATRRGIGVINTPGGNAVAAAELTMALMLDVARHVAQAHRTMAEGQWDRHRYVGGELKGKLLGVVGLGRIGTLVAMRARAFEMGVQAYDPYLSDERAQALGIAKVELDDLIQTSDIITIHVPLTDSTRAMFGPAELGKMKPTATIINCARGGLVQEDALADALREGKLAGAALDVYTSEPPEGNPLIGLPQVVHTPHLGASTREAKENVASTVAHSLLALLRDGDYSVAVNLPYASVDLEEMAPYLDLAERLGRFQGGLLDGAPSRAEIEVAGGDELDTAPLLSAFLCGLLREACGEEVNAVNARVKADQLGLRVAEGRRPAEEGFPQRLVSRVLLGDTTHQIEGTLVAQGEPRIIRVDGHWIDLRPVGDMLVMRNLDVPGVMGKVGSMLGKMNINIGELRLGRGNEPKRAISVWQVDEPVGAEIIQHLIDLDEIQSVRQVRLGPLT